ncbi:MAG: PspC domain-containing protein [Bacillaceae bacterium]
MNKKLYRSREKRMIAGVIGGVSEYTGIDVTILRIIAVAAFFLGVGILGIIYIACIFIMPEGEDF